MFYEILVVDYISDFKSLTVPELYKLNNYLSDPQFLTNCPNGTIIGIPIDGNSNNQTKVYYPLLSHISMPIKSGERAWAFDQKSYQVSYWISRKVQNISAEDLNFTHDDRARTDPFLLEKSYQIANSQTFVDSTMSVIPLRKARLDSIARRDFVGEAVSSIKTKSSDLTFQGSNGTVINLSNSNDSQSGTIDLIAGLSESEKKESVLNVDGYREVIKPTSSVDSQPDDKSRVIISQKFNADEYYQIPGDNSGNNPTISLKSDVVRIISKKDFKIIVGTNENQSKILIKNDGNIVIEQGGNAGSKIKLTGEDADQPYIRYDELRRVITEFENAITNLQINIVAVAAVVDTLAGGAASSAITSQNLAINSSLEIIKVAMSQIRSEKILGS